MLTKNTMPAAPNATTKRPHLKYARSIAATHPANAPVGDSVLEKIAGNVMAASTVYGM